MSTDGSGEIIGWTEGMAIDPDLIARYRAIVMQLPPLNREVFLLHCIDDLEFNEIASRLSVPIQMAQRALADALIQIDRQLQRLKDPD